MEIDCVFSRDRNLRRCLESRPKSGISARAR
nr:MAG TPA: hypothetical protein [Caudoviricetes sp.]